MEPARRLASAASSTLRSRDSGCTLWPPTQVTDSDYQLSCNPDHEALSSPLTSALRAPFMDPSSVSCANSGQH